MNSTLRRDETFDLVYAGHYVTLVRLARLTTGDVSLAEDVVQDAFGDLLRRWSDVRDPVAYLRRAVVSRSTSWVRRRVLEHRHRGHPAHPVPADSAAEPADTRAVRAALKRLSARQRAAVFLRFYLDLPEAEIARALNCRPGTVKSLLHRAMSTMRGFLDEH